MALFGRNWLDEPVDSEPTFGRSWLDEKHSEYFINNDGEYQKIETKKELNDAIDNNNMFVYDGKNYHKKTL